MSFLLGQTKLSVICPRVSVLRGCRVEFHCNRNLFQSRFSFCLGQDCLSLLISGHARSGVYSVNPDGKGSFNVYCDMRTDGGGWTVFQRRQDGSVDFYCGWNDYKSGFGQLTAEFWLGNDKIHRLTAARPSSLRVELEDWNGVRVYAKYGKFNIGDEQAKYLLKVGSYSGTWRLAQKIEIMTITEVAALWHVLVPGGTTTASTPISTEGTWGNNVTGKDFAGIILDMNFHSNSLK